jgi:hypothetical protein
VAGAATGAATSSFLPQAAKAAAAMRAARTRDLFILIFPNEDLKTISDNCFEGQNGPQNREPRDFHPAALSWRL